MPALHGLCFPESLRWWDGELWFSDMYGLRVLAWSPDSGATREVAYVPGRPSGLGRLPDGRVIVVEMTRRRLLLVGSRESRVYAELAGCCGDLNDMVVDEDGRAYVGVPSAVPGEHGEIWLVPPYGEPELVSRQVVYPNGMLRIGPDLLVADSLASTVLAFAVDPASGRVGPARVWARLAPGTFVDGLCDDGAGGLWAGTLFGQVFLHLDAAGDECGRLDVSPEWAVTALRDPAGRLFLATAATSTTDLPEGRSQGRISAGTSQE